MENFKNVAPLSDFDWNAFENGATETAESKCELEKAYDQTLGRVSENEVVEGTVISINKREVVVNIGYKSDGIIPVNEFRYNPDLQVGDTVEVYIENQEDKKGQLVLSHKKLVQANLGSVLTLLLRTKKWSRVISSAARRVV